MSSSSSSGSDDESHDWKDLKHHLLQCISNIHSAGTFATFGVIENFVNPGVSIDPIGIVRLPLSEDDAHALIQASHQAPFGKGTETLVDESVRKTWEIHASKIRFLNKGGWDSCLDRIVGKVAKELGIAGGSQNIRAEFYKMLIYGKGGMFKAHKEYVTCRLHISIG